MLESKRRRLRIERLPALRAALEPEGDLAGPGKQDHTYKCDAKSSWERGPWGQLE